MAPNSKQIQLPKLLFPNITLPNETKLKSISSSIEKIQQKLALTNPYKHKQKTMYNYHTNEKKKQLSQQLEHLRDVKQKHDEIKAQYDQRLIRKFVERSTHGYERMLDANRDIKQYKEYHHQFRDIDPTKNIGPPSFYYQSRNSKERVNEAAKENKNLDQVPFFANQNPSHHKFRQTKSKHDFKFTSYDTTSRVLESVQNMKTNEVPSSWDINVRSYIKVLRQSNSSGNRNDTKRGHRNKISTHASEMSAKKFILPTLTIKHHPKSIESIQNKIKIGPLKDALVENKKITNTDQTSRKGALKSSRNNNIPIKSMTVHIQTLEMEDS